MVLGAANPALFLAPDWRYSIESITYHREALIIRKKADAPRLDEAQIGGPRGRCAARWRGGQGGVGGRKGHGRRRQAKGRGGRGVSFSPYIEGPQGAVETLRSVGRQKPVRSRL